ncbi:hypothetical protein [Roseomonas gilardii]|uniref:hypothetical protein n=1 Tax=Roseomonas gilardii TaxID=257708 RepID=UPI0004844379|nr:hypothetical protein [Roseomonas gilardii]SUE44295.1 Uncharacterised protein [Roseomonas gilardii subsp. rosea]
MTHPAPTFATAARSAAEEDAEIAEWIATHEEDVSRLRLRLAEMPVNDTQRKHVRTRLAEAMAAVEDAQAARAALKPRLEAERGESRYQRAREAHQALLAEIDTVLLEQAASIDRLAKHLVACISVTAANVEKVAARAALPAGMILPDGRRFAEHILGQLVAAGLIDDDHMPARYMDGGSHIPEFGMHAILSPAQMVARDGARVAVQEVRFAVQANAPRSPALLAQDEAERAAAQRRRERCSPAPAAAAAQPAAEQLERRAMMALDSAAAAARDAASLKQIMGAVNVMSRASIACAAYAIRPAAASFLCLDIADRVRDAMADLDEADDAVLPLLARVRSGVGIPGALRSHQAILGRAKASVFDLRYPGLRRVPADITRLSLLAVAEVDRSVARMRADMLAACSLEPHPRAPLPELFNEATRP